MLSQQIRNLEPRRKTKEAKSPECQVVTSEDHGHDIEAPKQPLKSTNKGVATPKHFCFFIFAGTLWIEMD
ncbi:hypothetical protein J1N35_035177 [Gossypium stocksii]|uniref:Uncharacterized protein n=1 Tax=Gossypium stocksii TaxID=47602 RepID=A0A9D3ZR88_9ROSI|nr:hypothetical protein J1N35_035177 [Gossypium stocksii]